MNDGGGGFRNPLLIWIAVNTLGTSYESTRTASSSVSILQQGRAQACTDVIRTPGRIVLFFLRQPGLCFATSRREADARNVQRLWPAEPTEPTEPTDVARC